VRSFANFLAVTLWSVVYAASCTSELQICYLAYVVQHAQLAKRLTRWTENKHSPRLKQSFIKYFTLLVSICRHFSIFLPALQNFNIENVPKLLERKMISK
jgi:hypothetical protein